MTLAVLVKAVGLRRSEENFQAVRAENPVIAADLAIRHGWGISVEAGSTWRDAAWRTAALSADRRGGIAAFVEKRKPAWPGRRT